MRVEEVEFLHNSSLIIAALLLKTGGEVKIDKDIMTYVWGKRPEFVFYAQADHSIIIKLEEV